MIDTLQREDEADLLDAEKFKIHIGRAWYKFRDTAVLIEDAIRLEDQADLLDAGGIKDEGSVFSNESRSIVHTRRAQ